MKSFWNRMAAVWLSGVVAASGADFIVNSTTQSMTYNWKDSGAIYWYRLNGGELEYKTGGTSWLKPPALPYPGCQFKNIAANGNRILGLTTDNELYLGNLVEDTAEWVLTLLDVIAATGDAAHPILVALGVYEEGYGYRLGTLYYPTPWHWMTAYHDYILEYHQPWAWAPVDRDGINYDRIQDIAIGNWNGTVTTIYVLDADTQALYYIDEEPVMLEWEPVKGAGALTGLTSASRIDADHSVICVASPDSIDWVRFDYHQPDQLPILNWTELAYPPPFDNTSDHPGWHHMGNPTGEVDEFRIDVRCADGTPWPVPKTFNLVDLGGILGYNPIEPPWQYPVRIIIRDTTGMDNYFHLRLRHAKEMDSMPDNVTLNGDYPFSFGVPMEGYTYFVMKLYPDPNTYLSPLMEDCYIHAKNKITITNDITVNPQPGSTFRAAIIPE